MQGAGGGVTCTAWIHNAAGESTGETICERIDHMLYMMGESAEQLEIENDAIARGDHDKKEPS
jgi:hypothetical protein